MISASSSSGCRPACLTPGTIGFIGLFDEMIVLKSPHIPDDEEALALLGLEARVLQAIGLHKHIIGFKRLIKYGLLHMIRRCILRYSARITDNRVEEGRRTWIGFRINVCPSIPDWYLVWQINDFAFISRDNFSFISKDNLSFVSQRNFFFISLVRYNKCGDACFLTKYHRT